jgi:hypothetical protein
MENLLIESTKYLPLIDFSTEGTLKLEGRSIPEDVNKIFNPMIEFVDHLSAPIVIFDIKLDYFNTASSKKILDLLKHLDSNKNVKQIQVTWHFEEGDEDSVETAEIYEEYLLRTDFRYKKYAEAA